MLSWFVCHSLVRQVLPRVPFLSMAMAAGLCSSWADESSAVHGCKQMLPDSASVTEIVP